MATEQQRATEGKEFGYTRLVPEDPGGLLDADKFSVFLVQVKSNSDIGREELNDPLTVLRREIPEMELPPKEESGQPPTVRAQVHRVNAEIPANPVRRSTVWMIYPGSTTAVGVQYKYQHSDT
ncbi:MAG: hypothetical protein ACRDOP_12630 [Gaiellaceae bacterium]